MLALAEKIEKQRITHAEKTSQVHKADYGQFFTPYRIASFMASLFPRTEDEIRLLDPGAGIGTLSCAFLARIKNESWNIPKISVDAYEVDKSILGELKKNIEESLSEFKSSSLEIFCEDFLKKTSFEYLWKINQTYTHIIMNPPYKKILASSDERKSARAFGLETVNLYSAFLGAAISLAEKKGFISAIIPRSFCSGAYYKQFREFILKNCAIRNIHLFKARNKAFSDESVLQENIIILLQKKSEQKDVKISSSTDGTFSDFSEKSVKFEDIVHPFDNEKYFNIPTEEIAENLNSYKENNLSGFKSLEIQVSTGPIVDFRMKDLLLKDFQKCSVPLVYSVHLRNFHLDWPKISKKPNAIKPTEETEKTFFPKGFYVAVKRFSTKEEQKRIVASIITPEDFATEKMAFENHLNVFHNEKNSLDENLAYGLVCYLNSTFFDEKFRLFSGHTQVNATDLRNLPYPKKEILCKIGKKLKEFDGWNQILFDKICGETISPDKKTFTRFVSDIAWETEAWIADNPSHMIHFNGEKFLGPIK